MTTPDTFAVVVARIGRPHGLRGEVTVHSHTDEPHVRFAPGTRLRVDGGARGAVPGELVVATARPHQDVWLIGFDGVEDRTAAERLRGIELVTDATVGEFAEEDAWYLAELVGLVAEDPHGAVIGRVESVLPGSAQDLLVVALADGGSAYVPFVEAIVPVVDVDGGRVVVDAPPGLLDLNR
jgi:16S rRNA processing protein RimM